MTTRSLPPSRPAAPCRPVAQERRARLARAHRLRPRFGMAWLGAWLLVAGVALAAGPLEEAARLRDAGSPAEAALHLQAALRSGQLGDGASEVRLELARLLLSLDRPGPAFNHLARLRRDDPDYFVGAGGAELLADAERRLQPWAEEVLPRQFAQVFVLPETRGGSRVLYRELRSAGVDVVALRAFHLRGDRPHAGAVPAVGEGCYFPARSVPLVADRLAEEAAAARAAGLEFLAWMTTRRTPLSRVSQQHREMAWDPATATLEPGETWDLFDPVVVHVLEGVFADLARTGVDGALLQDDLMLRHLEGFSRHARLAYRQRTGRELAPERLVRVHGDPARPRVEYLPEYWDFAAMKRDRLLDVAERLQAAARRVNPDFDMALNLYYETALNPRFGLAWMAQDLEAAAARDFRWLAVMAYHRQIGVELSLDERGLDEALRTLATRLRRVPDAEERVVVKLQGIDWRDREVVSPGELGGVAAHFRGFATCLAPADDPAVVGEQLRAIADATARRRVAVGGSGP